MYRIVDVSGLWRFVRLYITESGILYLMDRVGSNDCMVVPSREVTRL